MALLPIQRSGGQAEAPAPQERYLKGDEDPKELAGEDGQSQPAEGG